MESRAWEYEEDDDLEKTFGEDAVEIEEAESSVDEDDEDRWLEELENKFFELNQPVYVKIVKDIRVGLVAEPELMMQFLQDVRERKPNTAEVADLLFQWFSH